MNFVLFFFVSLQKFFFMPHCVMVAQQILVLYVWVRVLVGQQKFSYK